MGKTEAFLSVFLLIHVLLLTEKFSEMKDEIPQAVIDSHVKNAANARAEKVKQETSEENTGALYITQLSDKLLFLMCTRGILFALL